MSLVIVGSGPYAIALANKYKIKHPKQEVILIALHDETIFLPAAPRSVVDGDISKNVVPITHLLNAGIILIKGWVEEVRESSVVFKCDGELGTIYFRVLVVATGATHSVLATGGNFMEEYKESKASIEKANNIVFLGGGEVAVEVAGEIRNLYPKKKITIVHNKKSIMSDKYKKSLRKKVKNKIDHLKIETLLGYQGEEIDGYVLAKKVDGTQEVTLKADHIIRATGYVKGNFPPVSEDLGNIVDEENYAIIDADFTTLARNIFAVGEVAKAGSYVYLDFYLDITIYNIELSLQGHWKSEFKRAIFYKDKPTCAISFGPKDGYGQIKFPVVGTWALPSFFWVSYKSRDLMVGRIPELYGKQEMLPE